MAIIDLDREVQKELLEFLGARYPAETGHDELLKAGFSEAAASANLEYLAGHGLLERSEQRLLRKPFYPHVWVKLSSAGIDFQLGDGGLGAILGVVTVRLHDDTIRALLIDKVQASAGPEGVKAKLVDAIKSAPAETLRTVTQRAVEAGIQNLPNAVQLLQGWLANG